MKLLDNYEFMNSSILFLYLAINIMIWHCSKAKDVRDFTILLLIFNLMVWVMSIFDYCNWYNYENFKYFAYVENASIIGYFTVAKELYNKRNFNRIDTTSVYGRYQLHRYRKRKY